MFTIPRDFERRLKKEYPRLEVKWNPRVLAFEVIEDIRDRRLPPRRVIWQYENADGSRLPFIPDHCIEFLHSIDTRKWPLKERVKIMRQERDAEIAAQEKRRRDFIHDHVADNEIYFSSSERFFMDPKSCPEWKTKYMPSQERVLRSRGQL